MPKNLSSSDVAQILKQIGITLKRRGKEDVFAGEVQGHYRVVIVPRNKSNIPQGTLSSIWRQAGIDKKNGGQTLAKALNRHLLLSVLRLSRVAHHESGGSCYNCALRAMIHAQITQMEMTGSIEARLRRRSLPDLRHRVKTLLAKVPPRPVQDWA